MTTTNSRKPHHEALVDYLEQLLHEDAAVAEESTSPAGDNATLVHASTSQHELPEPTEWSLATVSYRPDNPPATKEPEAEDQPETLERATETELGCSAEQAEQAGHIEASSEPAQSSCVPVAADDERHYLFEVAGLTIAVPARRVSAEQTLDAGPDESGGVVCLINAADERTLPVIDLAGLMLPTGAAVLQQPLPQRAPTLVLLDDGQWGLAGAGPGRLEDLSGQPVCWRRSEGGRAWLAGTLAERSVVVINLDVLAGMLP